MTIVKLCEFCNDFGSYPNWEYEAAGQIQFSSCTAPFVLLQSQNFHVDDHFVLLKKTHLTFFSLIKHLMKE